MTTFDLWQHDNFSIVDNTINLVRFEAYINFTILTKTL